MRAGLAAVALLLSLAGCATVPAPPPAGTVNSPLPGREPAPPATGAEATGPGTAAPSPLPGTPVGTTASGGKIVSTQAAPGIVDSLPSADALAVLESIPEPLSAGERVPAPTRPAAPDSAAGDSATARAGGAEPDTAGVPIPAPTRPLGDRPGGLLRAADTLSTAPGVSPSGAAPSPASAAGAGASGGSTGAKIAPADSCWRVQVAAPPEAEKAATLREAAQSQLLIPMTIDVEKGLYKVRTRNCLGSDTADRLRRRALDAGFAGAFRFRGSPK